MTLGLLKHCPLPVACSQRPVARHTNVVQPFCTATGGHKSRRRHYDLRQHFRCQAVSEPQTDSQPEVQIEGIDQTYCDDFVCTSSPAVEQTLRALARDLTRISTWTPSLFSDEVRYKVRTAFLVSAQQHNRDQQLLFGQDKFRSSEGVEQYKRKPYLAGAVQNPKVVC